MEIKILESSGWYKHFVDSEFEVGEYDRNNTRLPFKISGMGWVYESDCVITELPESFCVKRCDDGIKWWKYIQWLNKTYNTDLCGRLFNFDNPSDNPYYGVINDEGWGVKLPFGTEIHIDDMIKHIDYMESQQYIKGGKQFSKESQLTINMKQEFDLNRKDAEILFPELSVEVAYNLLKCLATGTDDDLHECIKISPSSEISKLEGSKSYYEGIIAIKNRFNNYINMRPEFDLTTDEGRLEYSKKYYPIGTKYEPLDCYGNVRKCRSEANAIFKPRIWVDDWDRGIEVSGVGLIYHEKTNRWAEIIKEEKNMETQKLSRQGLKEIHSVACSSWKLALETSGLRNPLEDYVELTQEEVDKMFRACTKEQLPIVSKYLKQDDGSVDVTKLQVSGKGIADDNFYLIRDRELGEYKRKSFLLSEQYNWEIKTDNVGQLCLIPTRR